MEKRRGFLGSLQILHCSKKTPSLKKAALVMKGMKKISASNNIADDIAKMVMKHFSISGKHLALSLWPLEKNEEKRTRYRGQALIYPASIVKLCYMVAAFAWFEERKVKQTGGNYARLNKYDQDIEQ